jgi:hypothetical protein
MTANPPSRAPSPPIVEHLLLMGNEMKKEEQNVGMMEKEMEVK